MQALSFGLGLAGFLVFWASRALKAGPLFVNNCNQVFDLFLYFGGTPLPLFYNQSVSFSGALRGLTNFWGARLGVGACFFDPESIWEGLLEPL